MSLSVVCVHCGHEYRAEQGATRHPCPNCGDGGLADETAEWPVPPELRAAVEFEDPDVAEE